MQRDAADQAHAAVDQVNGGVGDVELGGGDPGAKLAACVGLGVPRSGGFVQQCAGRDQLQVDPADLGADGRDRGDRRRRTAGASVAAELDRVVARRLGGPQRRGGDEQREPGEITAALAAARRIGAQQDLVVGHCHVFEPDIVRTGRAQAHDIPGFLDAQAGRVLVHGDAGQLAAAILDRDIGHEPGQGGGQRGERLTAVDSPAAGAVGRQRGLRASAALRRAQLRLGRDLIAERTILDHAAQDAAAQGFGPGAVGAFAADAHQVHADRVGQRHVGLGQRGLRGDEVGQVALVAAVFARHGRLHPARGAQIVNRFERERGVAVVRTRTLSDQRQRRRDPLNQLAAGVVCRRQLSHALGVCAAAPRLRSVLQHFAQRLERAGAQLTAIIRASWPESRSARRSPGCDPSASRSPSSRPHRS